MTTALMAVTIFTAVLIVAVHILSVFGHDLTAKIASCIGIILHIVLFICLLLLKTDISVAVLIFMCSVLLYTVLYAIRFAADKKRISKLREENK